MSVIPLDSVCQNAGNCPICRDREGGREFRSLVNMPTVDFECRRGKPWGFCERPAHERQGTPHRAATVLVKATPYSATAKAPRPAVRKQDNELGRKRLAICKRLDCEELGNICEARFPDGICSGGFQSWLADPNSECPLGHWQKEL